jgi:antitoxin component YwqK of YwqJK toxin-antitoxin module
MKKNVLLLFSVILSLSDSIGQIKIYLTLPTGMERHRQDYKFVNPSDTTYLQVSHQEDMGVHYSHSYSFNSGLPDGEYQVFVNGKLALKAFFKNRQKDSIWTSYGANGKVQRMAPYVNDRLNGKVLEFNSDYRSILPYKNDSLNGLSETYYSNGKLRSECMYTMNTTFMRTIYHENGQLKERTFYLGEPIRRESFGRDGRLEGIEGLIESEYFKNGYLNGKRNLWSGDYYISVVYANNQLLNWEVYRKGGELIAKKDGREHKVFGKILKQ